MPRGEGESVPEGERLEVAPEKKEKERGGGGVIVLLKQVGGARFAS